MKLLQAPCEHAAMSMAGIVHDLGNLIQIATSAIGIVSRTPDMPAVHAGPILARARCSLEQAGAIVRQSLGGLRDHATAIDHTNVQACLADIAALIETMETPELVLETAVTADLPEARCDPIRLRRALLNLVFNARDAILENGLVVVEARTIRRDRLPIGVEIRVIDNGIGMSPATIARCCDPFFTTKPDGLGGVGLPMVDRFVRDAGGEMAIESAPGIGTTVTLRLPAAVPPQTLSQELEP
ncbi:signal transduction histidine kinase [Sphingomonas naasensis]|nr:ATP-binding protein [Sphingomonas naasensis]NIJ21644.1 signal transduction histidine kinase [Sphingomonas naasensis]